MLVFFFIAPPQLASIAMCMFFFIASEFHELNVIKISLIINVYDCGTVTGNGLLLNLLCSKALIIFIFAAFCSGSCLCASSARFYFNIL